MSTFRVALSVSPFTEQVLSSGARLTDGERTAASVREVQELFREHGATEVFVRFCTARETAPQVDAQSLSDGLERCRMAADLGLALNPEFGLWANYGDVLRQPGPDFSQYPELEVPGPWAELTVDQMCRALHGYGALVAREVRETGAQVEFWDIGNEVDLGIAGVAPRPIGGAEASGYQPPDRVDPEIGRRAVTDLIRLPVDERIDWLQRHVWPHEARLLAAFAEGITTVVPDARFSTHLSGLGASDTTLPMAFWEAMRDGGYVPDEIGYSYYPSSPASSLDTFKQTITRTTAATDRPAFVAEYAYAAAPMEGEHLFADWDTPEGDYPISEEGQARLLEDLTRWGVENRVTGIRPWAPDLAWGLWAPMALFRAEGMTGEARPALDAMRRALST